MKGPFSSIYVLSSVFLRFRNMNWGGVARVSTIVCLSAFLIVAPIACHAGEWTEDPSAKALLNWIDTLPQSRDRQSVTFEFFATLRASLAPPQDGRHRFVLPVSQTRAKRQAAVLRQAFSTDAERKQFDSLLNELLQSIRDQIRRLDSSNENEKSFRLKWVYSGLSQLSSQAKNETWPPANAILNPKRTGPNQNPNHPVTNWRGSSYEWIRTPHFDIASRGSKADSALMAELCEQVYAVWQQIFFPYWSRTEKQDNAPTQLATAPFQVVLFSNKKEYEESLKRQLPNVDLSTGFYSQEIRHSFFYMDQNKSYATLVHELTHQFFAEAASSALEFDPDSTAGFWAAEGIAVYMESLSVRELGPAILVDVGGWDSPRLQSARFHFLRNETWLKMDSFGQLNGVSFRKPEDISLRYSFAGGLAHRWMDSGGDTRRQLIEYLRHLYFQDIDAYLEPWDDQDLPRVYATFMQSASQHFESFLPFPNRSDLVLSRCEVKSDQLVSLFSIRSKWNWIDLSFNELDDSFLMSDSYKLDPIRLSLENTNVTDRSLASIAQMPRIEELDLSNCSVTDQGLTNLQGNRTLKTLWLSGTKISDETLKVLESCSKLEAVHMDRTDVTAEAWTRLLKAKPRLRAASTPP